MYTMLADAVEDLVPCTVSYWHIERQYAQKLHDLDNFLAINI